MPYIYTNTLPEMKPNQPDNMNISKTTINTADRLTAKRLHEYGKRHGLTADAQNLVSFLYVNGPSGCIEIMKATGLAHDKFFAALCVANGVLIMDKRAITVDVCLTSRRAIAAIPESALQPSPSVGPRPSADNAGGELSAATTNPAGWQEVETSTEDSAPADQTATDEAATA